MVVDKTFWNGKKILVTGHTGFKGSWLTLWLTELGAKICGLSNGKIFENGLIDHIDQFSNFEQTNADVKNFDQTIKAVKSFQPEIVFHLAAQSLVRPSYDNPVDTYSTNIMGTVHLLEACRNTPSVRSVLIVTSDKCYENKEWDWGYRENDPMGGFDPYSSSKGCAELVTSAYQRSYFSVDKWEGHKCAIASARAGNVVGGADWSADRLVPDLMRGALKGETIEIRSPKSIRPWQHVLEPLSGYMSLAQALVENPKEHIGGWNFGPKIDEAKNVEWIVNKMQNLWPENFKWKDVSQGEHVHEATYLKLDISKSLGRLNWSPRWSIDQTLEKTVNWYKVYSQSKDKSFEFAKVQIAEYQGL